jgi:uncharacterized HAD superfamily protein
MKIGIDLDGVVFDSEKEFRVYSELYEVEVLKRNSIINSQEIAFQKRYKWTQEEIEDFLNRYHEKIVLESNFMPGAREVLNKLISLNYFFYFIYTIFRYFRNQIHVYIIRSCFTKKYL